MVWDPEVGWICVECYDKYLNNAEKRKIADKEKYDYYLFNKTLKRMQDNYLKKDEA